MLYSRLIPLAALFGAVVLGEKDEGGDGENQFGKAATTTTMTTAKATAKVKTSAKPTTTKVKIEALCFPTDTAGMPLPDAPCNQIGNLTSVCHYASLPSKPEETPLLKSLSEQQKCFCDPEGAGAYLFEALAGCGECERKHGQRIGDGWIPVEWISAQSSSYCALPSPTVNLDSFFETWAPASSIDFGTRTGGINVLGTSTEVGLYFTSTPIAAAASATITGATVTGGSSTTKAVVACSSGVGICAGAPSSSTGAVGSATASGSSPATTLNNSAAGLRTSGFFIAIVLGIAFLI
ncbi:hypothetical protein MMC30_001713 [Trapelia coarctata]|nr:hypothetical protein [Trapelia coarctata]